MISSIVLCLLVASSAFAFPADTPTDGGCPGGYANGAEIERGRLIFVCQSGQVVPKGCIAEDLTRLSIGSNYDTKHYRKQCKLGSDGELTYELSGCVANGQEHKVGQTWEDGNNFFTCKTDGSALKVVNQGCVDGGKRVNIGEKVTKDDHAYTCKETVNGGSKLVQSGCFSNGQQHDAGSAFENGKEWFKCVQTGREKVVAKPAGCVNNGKRLNDGDRYFENDVSYECRVENGKIDVRATGCVQKDESGNIVQRRLGCTWVEGQAPFQYEWACEHDAPNDSAKKVQVRCNYRIGSGVLNVEPGCYRKTYEGDTVVGCIDQGSSLKLQSFQGESAEQSAASAGLRAC